MAKTILALSLLASSDALVAPRALPSTSRAAPAATQMSLAKYSDELQATAKAMTLPGKGLLACDESTGTVGARLESIGLENTEENRQTWRNLLFTTPGINEYISGAILFEETLFQDDPNGKPFVDARSPVSERARARGPPTGPRGTSRGVARAGAGESEPPDRFFNDATSEDPALFS